MLLLIIKIREKSIHTQYTIHEDSVPLKITCLSSQIFNVEHFADSNTKVNYSTTWDAKKKNNGVRIK